MTTRMFFREQELRNLGMSEPMITTFRVLTEFVQAQNDLAAARTDIDANATDITALAANDVALDARIDAYDALAPFVRQNQAARPSYTPYAGQTVSVLYTQAEAQATDNAVLALSTAFDTLLTRLDTVNLLT